MPANYVRRKCFSLKFRPDEQITTVTITATQSSQSVARGQLKCDGTRAETRLRISAKRTSPLKPAGASVQSTTGSRGVRISGSNAGYTTFRGGVKSTGYPLDSPVSPSLPLPCVTVCHHISNGVYQWRSSRIKRLTFRAAFSLCT
jgi:hypothetical protein